MYELGGVLELTEKKSKKKNSVKTKT